ncbi:MAG: hypothetical protein ACOH5I_06580 [Oligoflexus sp.]
MPPIFPEASHIENYELNQTSGANDHQSVMLTAENSAQALSLLYKYFKAKDAKYSLSYICRRLDLSSKGYISDVFHGRRLLHSKHWKKVAELFHLSPPFEDLLYLLFQRDLEKSDEKLRDLDELIGNKRKSLAFSREVLPDKLRGMFFAFDVFCAFGLFQNQPQKQQLRNYFGVERGLELEVALNILLTTGLIEKYELDSYRLVKNHIRFSDSEDGMSHVDFLKQSIENARQQVEKWKEKTDQSIFASNIISVRKSDYVKAIEQLKRNLLEIQSNLESQDADMLIRFNIQIYPA